MNTYETSAIVEAQGEVRVVGVPFAPGTEVEITISPKRPAEEEAPSSAAALTAARELFGTIKGFRNSPRMPREELYERGSLR
jgi:hypothetical protein